MSKSPSQAAPPLIVIFGITGDLSQRYLLPALYHLIKDDLLAEEAEIIGISRRDITVDELFEKVEQGVKQADEKCDPGALKAMRRRSRMIQLDLDDPAAYKDLLQTLNDIEDQKGLCMNRLYYLSIPPTAYQSVVKLMGEAKLNTSCQHGEASTRLLVEKPFGFDLESAQELIDQTAKVFAEEQVFRIDHFLAKEPVQNIMVFRSQNPIFEALWNREYIASLEISASEQIGIEGRADFYEPLGALRDFIQNHLLQLMALTTMDLPESLESTPIHRAKQALLKAVEPIPLAKVRQRVVRGQYEGYRQEVKNPDSITETYAHIVIHVDSERWQGVPVSLQTGKALAEKKYDVTVNFKSIDSKAPNRLCFRIQPNEGIEFDFITRQPGLDNKLGEAALDYSSEQNPSDNANPNAYERVLLDAVQGNHTLFATSGEVLSSWRILQPVLDAWKQSSDDLKIYEPGSNGPVITQ